MESAQTVFRHQEGSLIKRNKRNMTVKTKENQVQLQEKEKKVEAWTAFFQGSAQNTQNCYWPIGGCG